MPDLQLLPGSRSFRDVESLSKDNRQTAQTLGRHLAVNTNAYDFVLIDCPPSLGDLTQAALAASTEVLMPIQCEYFAMEGLTQMIHVIRKVMQNQPGRLEFGGILLTMYDPRLELTHEVEAEVRDFFGDIVFDTVIPRTWPCPRRPATACRSWTMRRARRVREPTSNFAWRYWNMSKDRRLGRGLAALLGTPLDEVEPATGASGELQISEPPREDVQPVDAAGSGQRFRRSCNCVWTKSTTIRSSRGAISRSRRSPRWPRA